MSDSTDRLYNRRIPTPRPKLNRNGYSYGLGTPPRVSRPANDNDDGRWKVNKRSLIAAKTAQRNESSRAYLRNSTKCSVEKGEVKFSSRPLLCFRTAMNMNSFTVFVEGRTIRRRVCL